ncbi:Aminoglycoside phosphotransferase [Macrophomina phaseolina MS6]|uniref:Aminoglycoside phosphotransferase n=2 Tax=Macrophomina phaseolina TaxID=35725 RepID=K2RTQ9_MACPH|nr:Aminoglycoside phosphotransferase [Macrophomina phaseolina MS6]
MGTTAPTPRSRVPRRPWRLLSEDVPLIPENAVDLFPEKLGPRIFYLPSANAILKKGPTVRMAEAEAMRFVRARLPGVPVPEVYQSFIKDDLGFILMEKIEGRPLSEVWDRLDDEKCAYVIEQLRGFINQWRQLKGTWYGSLGGGSSIANYGTQHHHPHHRGSTGSRSSDGSSSYNPHHPGEASPPPPQVPAIEPGSGPGGPCEDLVFKHLCLASPGEQKTYGPFNTRVEYNTGVIEALCNSRATGQLNDTDEPLIARIRAEDACDDKVFTHGDLQPVNIMVDPKTLRITGILDWETAGYSPPEREYCEARSRGREEGWRRALESMFGEEVKHKYKLWRDIDWALVAHSRVWSK